MKVPAPPQASPAQVGFLLVLLLAGVVLLAWMYRDARARYGEGDSRPALWVTAGVLLGLFLPPVPVWVFVTGVVYFTFRPQGRLQPCPLCGRLFLPELAVCPWCRQPTLRDCPRCHRAVAAGHSHCPHCHAPL